MNQTSVTDKEIVIERIFDAPIDLVWSAWSDPAHIGKWWGPSGFTNTIEQFELREGGDWHLVMHGPDGTRFPNHNRFVEVRKPHRLVIDHLVYPIFRITVTFEEIGRQTKMVFRQAFESAEVFKAVKPHALPGSQQMFDRLADVLNELAGPALPR